MTWQRGLLRTWLAITIVWSTAVVFYGIQNGAHGLAVVVLAALIAALPLAIFAAAFAFWWLIGGFRRHGRY